jgi:hypothetical protein
VHGAGISRDLFGLRGLGQRRFHGSDAHLLEFARNARERRHRGGLLRVVEVDEPQVVDVDDQGDGFAPDGGIGALPLALELGDALATDVDERGLAGSLRGDRDVSRGRNSRDQQCCNQ